MGLQAKHASVSLAPRMRLPIQEPKPTSSVAQSAGRIPVFGRGQGKAPSQKELAGILMITTRHLRRWEMAEAAANQPCSRPYTHADLWRLFQRRSKKGWDRTFAERLGLAEVFHRFEAQSAGEHATEPLDNKSTLAAMLLRSLITDPGEDGAGEGGLPKMFGAGMAATAKAQLCHILDCESAQAILVKAFFEAALVAEAQLGVVQVPSASKALLSA